MRLLILLLSTLAFGTIPGECKNLEEGIRKWLHGGYGLSTDLPKLINSPDRGRCITMSNYESLSPLPCTVRNLCGWHCVV